MSSDASLTTRDFTVATFVVHAERVLLLYHRTLAMWLPPGGHIDQHELPDEAAVREVVEETGIVVVLTGQPAFSDMTAPRQLIRPEGIQLEQITPTHQHIDLVYFARPAPGAALTPTLEAGVPAGGWYRLSELADLGANDEIIRWCERAVATLTDA